jgi:hypothetical protein
VVTADPIAGTWSGQATHGEEAPFEVRLQIAQGCALDQRCGTMSVSNIPCLGDLYLRAVSNGRYEFAVNDFSADSGEACSPGPGEYFTPQPDGSLGYTTAYDPRIQGTLHRA